MKSLNKIACFLMLCWMVVIFMFSAEPDTESSELSGSVSYRIVSVVNTITASHWDEKELLDKAELIDYPVRKCCLLYTSPSPRDPKTSRMPSSA